MSGVGDNKHDAHAHTDATVATAAKKTNEPGALDWILHDADPITTYKPDIDVELSRLQALKSFQLLDKEPQKCYNRLANISASVFGASVALISLVDLGRVWHVATSTTTTNATTNANGEAMKQPDIPREFPRTRSISSHTILQKELLLVVPDLLDSRFRDYPIAELGFRFYAGTPLVSPEGAHIGALSILDTRPRTAASFGEEHQEQLVDLATTVMDLMTEKRQSQSSNAQFYPGFTFSYDVQRAATFLRQQIASLKDDNDFQTVAGDRHRSLLQSACDTADFLQSSLAPDGRQSQQPSAHRNTSMDRVAMPPPPNRDSSSSLGASGSRVGEHRAMDMEMFVASLEEAIEAFPRKTHVSISLHPELPHQLMFNDLKVFRSAIALLTSACERTQDGFVRFRIFPKIEGGLHQRQSRVVLFECEDTGRDVDLERFENLFQAPTDVDVGYEPECIHVNSETGRVEHSPVCEDNQNEPVSGGFAVHAVAQYMDSVGGKYGFRPRFVQNEAGDSSTGSIFWFSIPLQLVPAVSPRSTSSVLDSVIDSALESAPLSNNHDSSIHRVDRSQRPYY